MSVRPIKLAQTNCESPKDGATSRAAVISMASEDMPPRKTSAISSQPWPGAALATGATALVAWPDGLLVLFLVDFFARLPGVVAGMRCSAPVQEVSCLASY